jgi:hypothetical protein
MNVISSKFGNVLLLLGIGDGNFRPTVNFGVGRGPYFVAIGDFNGDGMQDLATANRTSNNVSVLINSTPQ